MPSVGDVLETSMCGEMFDQDVCNVFYWVVAAWTGNMDLQEFADQLAQQLKDVMIPFQSNQLAYKTLSVYNLTSPGEKTTRPLTGVGGIAGATAESPFVAASIQLIGETEITRDGYKRFGGIDDPGIGNGGVLSATYKNLLNAVGDVLSAEVIVDDGVVNGATLTPVIVGTNSATGARDLTRVNPIGSYITQDYVTTQNSRKRGRGS